MLSVIMPSVIILSVIMLIVIIMGVVALQIYKKLNILKCLIIKIGWEKLSETLEDFPFNILLEFFLSKLN